MTKNTIVLSTNKAFNKANAARKRVLIAKDVLAQILQGKYRVTKGVYFRANEVSYNFEVTQKSFNKIPSCTVCGIGATFCSALRLGNKFNQYAERIDSHQMRQMLSRYFSHEQINSIEYAFEGWDGMDYCQSFHYKFRSDTDKTAVAQAIFNNIIKNKGTFLPQKDLSKN